MTGYSNQPIPKEAAKQLLALDLQDKEILSYEKIDQWYTAWDGKCYVSFSGGKDSTVLAYLVARYLSSFRTPPWGLTLVFVNTGLEYPEIQHFANDYSAWLQKEFPRIEVQLVRLRPKLNIRQVIAKYGYSIASKEVANCVWKAKKNPTGTRAKRIHGELLTPSGEKSPFCCDKWEYLLYAPFTVSGECCRIMKKSTAHSYESKSKQRSMTAMMAGESRQRTGCMFCAFGAHLEKGENRFERMRRTHPKHYDFCIGGGAYDPADGLWKPNEKGLGYGRVLDYIGVRY